MPIALSINEARESVANLNQILADTMTLRDVYKKHRWQIAGPTFYQLHLLYDKHATEQEEHVDAIAERVQLLGAVTQRFRRRCPFMTFASIIAVCENRRFCVLSDRQPHHWAWRLRPRPAGGAAPSGARPVSHRARHAFDDLRRLVFR